MLTSWGCGADPQEVDMGDTEATSAATGDGTSTGSSSSSASSSSSSTASSTAAGESDTTSAEPASTTDLATGTSDTTDGGSAEEPIRVMTYNIRHAELSTLPDIAARIEAEGADIVALQEVDQDTERSGHVLQADVLAELTQMDFEFFAAIPFQGGEYGVAILSRHPIGATQKVELTSSSEQRILAIAEVDAPGGLTLTIADTHMGLDAAERTQQATEIVTALDGRTHVVLMGDFNLETDESSYATLSSALVDVYPLVGQGTGNTIPSLVPNRRIDYVMIGQDWAAPLDAWVPELTDSDHRPVVAVLQP